MDTVYFKEANVVYAKNQPEYLPLSVHRTADGVVTSCWKLNFLDRIKVVIFGKIYVQLLTFNQPLQPQKLSVDKPVELFTKEGEGERCQI
jgi:hypothetical protein